MPKKKPFKEPTTPKEFAAEVDRWPQAIIELADQDPGFRVRVLTAAWFGAVARVPRRALWYLAHFGPVRHYHPKLEGKDLYLYVRAFTRRITQANLSVINLGHRPKFAGTRKSAQIARWAVSARFDPFSH